MVVKFAVAPARGEGVGPSVWGELQAHVCVSSTCRSEKQCTCFGRHQRMLDRQCMYIGPQNDQQPSRGITTASGNCRMGRTCWKLHATFACACVARKLTRPLCINAKETDMLTTLISFPHEHLSPASRRQRPAASGRRTQRRSAPSVARAPCPSTAAWSTTCPPG